MKLSVDPTKHRPLVCPLCGDEIPARRSHVILSPLSALTDPTPAARAASAGAIVCGRCMSAPTSHAALYGDCESPGCSLFDHSQGLCQDRAAAVFWLTNHGRIAPPTDSNTEQKE